MDALATSQNVHELIQKSRQQSTQPLHLFALVDAAQDPRLPRAIVFEATRHASLFGDSVSTPISKVSPHLVEIKPDHYTEALKWIEGNAPKTPCATLIASELDFDALLTHLIAAVDVRFDDGHEMFLAYWDPAILGSLLGQQDDDTLHVKGPVLNAQQQQDFLSAMTAWWYWDREAYLHQIDGGQKGAHNTRLTLSQNQIDALVEASVPDHLLSNIELNTPTLFDTKVSHARRYRFVRIVLESARAFGLTGMRDMTNFVALALIYKERIQTDETILHLLDQVQRKTMRFDDALKLMPE